MFGSRAGAASMLEAETRALLTRLAGMKPFALHETMVPAAGLSPAAQIAIERYLATGRKELRGRALDFLRWLKSTGKDATPEEMQRRFMLVRLRYNDVLSQFDLFSDSITQRSEHEAGVWLSGLDVVAADAMNTPGRFFTPPPVICYLDRGPGAAIRRARTRLPGGGKNPVAIIRVPRERMVGHGIASSLFHEVGHQVAALIGLVESLRPALQSVQAKADPRRKTAWSLWERWISEIVADFWSVSRAGIASTLGLIGVVSLPKVFVFRINTDDPHPTPWLRVKLSATIGNALYPHKHWGELARTWEAFYPQTGIDAERKQLLAVMQETMPQFVALLLAHRPAALRGASLADVGRLADRDPKHLNALYTRWMSTPSLMRRASPSLAFAVLGQARGRRRLTPEIERTLLGKLLSFWALKSSLDSSAATAAGRPLPDRVEGAPALRNFQPSRINGSRLAMLGGG